MLQHRQHQHRRRWQQHTPPQSLRDNSPTGRGSGNAHASAPTPVQERSTTCQEPCHTSCPGCRGYAFLCTAQPIRPPPRTVYQHHPTCIDRVYDNLFILVGNQKHLLLNRLSDRHKGFSTARQGQKLGGESFLLPFHTRGFAASHTCRSTDIRKSLKRLHRQPIINDCPRSFHTRSKIIHHTTSQHRSRSIDQHHVSGCTHAGAL